MKVSIFLLENALAIIQAMGIKLVSDSLQLAYDNKGMKYDVPIFCINPPISFSEKPL